MYFAVFVGVDFEGGFNLFVDCGQVGGVDASDASGLVVRQRGHRISAVVSVVGNREQGVCLHSRTDQLNDVRFQAGKRLLCGGGRLRTFHNLRFAGLGDAGCGAGYGDVFRHRCKCGRGAACGLGVHARQGRQHVAVIAAVVFGRGGAVEGVGDGDDGGRGDVAQAKGIAHSGVDGRDVGACGGGVFKAGQVRHWGDVDHGAQARCHAQGLKGRGQLGGFAHGLVQVIVLRTRVDDPDAHRAAVAADIDSVGPACVRCTGVEQCF